MPGGKHWSRSPSEYRGCSRSVGRGQFRSTCRERESECLYERSLTLVNLGPSVDLGVPST